MTVEELINAAQLEQQYLELADRLKRLESNLNTVPLYQLPPFDYDTRVPLPGNVELLDAQAMSGSTKVAVRWTRPTDPNFSHIEIWVRRTAYDNENPFKVAEATESPAIFTVASDQDTLSVAYLRPVMKDGLGVDLAACPTVAFNIYQFVIDTSLIADGSITSNKIAPNAVQEVHLAAAAVTTSKLANLAVDTNKLANLAVDAAKLADSAVTATKIANAAVGSAAIATAAIGSAHIANGAIQSAHIGVAQIAAAHIADAQIGTAKIADAAITNAKIANLAVLDAHISNVSVSKLLAGSAVFTGDVVLTRGSASLTLTSNSITLQSSINPISNLAITTTQISFSIGFGAPLFILSQNGLTLTVGMSINGNANSLVGVSSNGFRAFELRCQSGRAYARGYSVLDSAGQEVGSGLFTTFDYVKPGGETGTVTVQGGLITGVT